MKNPTRDDAMALLREFNETDELSDLIADVIEAMRQVAGDIGLAGPGGH